MSHATNKIHALNEARKTIMTSINLYADGMGVTTEDQQLLDICNNIEAQIYTMGGRVAATNITIYRDSQEVVAHANEPIGGPIPQEGWDRLANLMSAGDRL